MFFSCFLASGMSSGVNSSAASTRGSFGCPSALRKSWTMGVGSSLTLGLHVLLLLCFFSAYGKKVPLWQTFALGSEKQSGLLCPQEPSFGGFDTAPGSLR